VCRAEAQLPRSPGATAVFEDVLEIGRHYRREVYSIHPQPVPALIPRNRRFGFHERMRFDGSAERVPNAADIDAVIAQLAAIDIETVAIALLHAYANPDHEQRSPIASGGRCQTRRFTVVGHQSGNPGV